VIEAGADSIATAARAALAVAMPGTVVTVYPAEPETAAAPCVWLVFLEARHELGRWELTYQATVAADAALGAIDAQRQLGAMTSALLELEAAGVVTSRMVARGGGLTTRIGEVAHPCHLVTIPQNTSVC